MCFFYHMTPKVCFMTMTMSRARLVKDSAILHDVTRHNRVSVVLVWYGGLFGSRTSSIDKCTCIYVILVVR